MCSRKLWLCWKISVQCVKEINFFHSDITVIILHCQKLTSYNWRHYLSVTPRDVEKYDTARQPTDGNTTRRMRFSCWIIKAKNAHSEFVIHIAFPQQQWLHKGASLLRYTYIACLVLHNVTKQGSSESNFDMHSAKTLNILPFRMHINLLSSVPRIQTRTVTITSM